MKKTILRAVALLLIITSLTLFIYPFVSKQVIQEKNNVIIQKFDIISENVQDGDSEEAEHEGKVNNKVYPINEDGEMISDYPVVFERDLEKLYQDSFAYNEHLKERQDFDVDFSDAALNFYDYGIYNGIYGYISAPTVELNLPIYLGASDSNMAWGATHLTNTSLPLGGESTNIVIAGHTGYFGRVVFDGISNLNEGDTVSITTYFDTLDYRVISKKEITSTETNDIYIVKGKDLLTLITCARMGKSRFEVICERI